MIYPNFDDLNLIYSNYRWSQLATAGHNCQHNRKKRKKMGVGGYGIPIEHLSMGGGDSAEKKTELYRVSRGWCDTFDCSYLLNVENDRKGFLALRPQP